MPRPVVPMALPRRGPLAGLVEGHVVGQDQRAGRADAQALAHRHAALLQLLDLLEQRLRRQHHAVADQALHAVAQDARGDQVQHGLLAVADQRVAGVVPALEAHHGVGPLGEQIDDLALALVAPLGAEHYHVPAHATVPIACAPSRRSTQLPLSILELYQFRSQRGSAAHRGPRSPSRPRHAARRSAPAAPRRRRRRGDGVARRSASGSCAPAGAGPWRSPLPAGRARIPRRRCRSARPAPAPRRGPLRVGREHHAGVVAIATQLGEIDVDPDRSGMRARRARRQAAARSSSAAPAAAGT
jgi:hypothetical protein